MVLQTNREANRHHPTSSKGNVYPHEAVTVTKILFARVICMHGCPLQILTDRGTHFESDLFRDLYKLLAINKIRTTAYQPSTNGRIERFHATMHNLIAKWVRQNH